MVEILEPMKALTESVASGEPVARLPPQPEPGQPLPDRFFRRNPSQSRALDLAIDETSERYYPIAGWHVLALALPSRWSDSLEVSKKGFSRPRPGSGWRPVGHSRTVVADRY